MIQGAPENVCRRTSIDLEYELVLTEGHGLNGMKEHNTRYAPKQHIVEPDLESPLKKHLQPDFANERASSITFPTALIFSSPTCHIEIYIKNQRDSWFMGVKAISSDLRPACLDGAQIQL